MSTWSQELSVSRNISCCKPSDQAVPANRESLSLVGAPNNQRHLHWYRLSVSIDQSLKLERLC